MKIEATTRLQATGVQFLPERLVMLDCEMTGLDARKDDVIQIAAIKLEFDGQLYKQYKEPFNIFLHTDLQPTSEFARTHMVDVYRQANESKIDYVQAKQMLDEWLGDWKGKVSPVGDCVPTDILFLWAKKVITMSHYDGDTPVEGTFHFEYADMHFIKMLARQKMGYKFDKELPRIPGDHDGIVDCKNQLTELNGILQVLMEPS